MLLVVPLEHILEEGGEVGRRGRRKKEGGEDEEESREVGRRGRRKKGEGRRTKVGRQRERKREREKRREEGDVRRREGGTQGDTHLILQEPEEHDGLVQDGLHLLLRVLQGETSR